MTVTGWSNVRVVDLHEGMSIWTDGFVRTGTSGWSATHRSNRRDEVFVLLTFTEGR